MRSILKAAIFALLILCAAAAAYVVTSTRDVTTTELPLHHDAVEEAATEPTLDATTISRHIRRILLDYESLHQGKTDVFWLDGQETITEFMGDIDQWEGFVRPRLERYSNLSSLTADIYVMGGDFYLSRFYRGASFTTFNGSELREERLEVTVVDLSSARQFQFPSSLYYRQDWGSVMVVGIEMPRVWTMALLYHEMGHALRHRQGAPSATAPPTSVEYVQEEVEMHEVEYLVLNEGTNGALAALFADIRALAENPRDPAYVLAAVTRDHLVRYDQMLEAEGAGQMMSAIYLAQFLMSIGITTVNADDTLNEPEAIEAKVRWYRTVRGG